MSWSTRRKLAMLAAENGELAQAEQDLTSLIDALAQFSPLYNPGLAQYTLSTLREEAPED